MKEQGEPFVPQTYGPEPDGIHEPKTESDT